MSDMSMYRQVFDGMIKGMQLGEARVQMIGTPKSFNWNAAPTGQMDPAAYQVISAMPLWSELGNFSSQDAQFFSAVKSIFGHVTFKLSPEQMDDQQRLQNDCTNKSNDMVKANSDMNQAYMSSRQNGGPVFTARYPDLATWLDKAPEAAAYTKTIANATAAYQRAVDLKMELEKAAMPSSLQDAITAMTYPTGDPASTNAPVGWTKVAGGDGILRWQPEWKVGTGGDQWRAELSRGTQGGFSIDLNASDRNEKSDHSWAGGQAGYNAGFWSVSGGGGWDKSNIFNDDSSLMVRITVQSATRVAVTPGDWYPGGFLSELAKAQQGAAGQGYTIVAPWTAMGDGPNTLFGKNGLAGARVAELLVVYKPSFEISMSANTYQQNKEKFEASGGLRIGPFTFGGKGGHESSFTKSTATANKFTGASTSEIPQIVGIVVAFPGNNRP